MVNFESVLQFIIIKLLDITCKSFNWIMDKNVPPGQIFTQKIHIVPDVVLQQNGVADVLPRMGCRCQRVQCETLSHIQVHTTYHFDICKNSPLVHTTYIHSFSIIEGLLSVNPSNPYCMKNSLWLYVASRNKSASVAWLKSKLLKALAYLGCCDRLYRSITSNLYGGFRQNVIAG